MKIGIIADAHANEQALNAVLEDGYQQGVERWWFLGDAVGRGPSPVETVRTLKKLVGARRWIVGNHDLYVAGGLISDGIREEEKAIHADHKYRLERARGGLWRWCVRTWKLDRARPRRISTEQADIWLVHAMLDNALETNAGDHRRTYIMPWDVSEDSGIFRVQVRKLKTLARKNRTAVLIHGHTHIPYLAVKFRGMDIARLMPISYTEYIDLSVFEMAFINPGSVGQPRNGDSMVHAAYGILDTESSKFAFRRVPYDCRPTCGKMQANGYPRYLIDILKGNHPGNALSSSNDLWMRWKKVYEPAPWGWRPVTSTS